MTKHKSDRGWTEENVRIAKAISNKHAALVWICNVSAKRVERRQRVIGVIIAAGLYLFGASGIPAAITDSSDNQNSKKALLALSIMAICFGLFKTIVVSIQEDKKVGKNRWALGIHAELTKDIRKELNKDIGKRQKWRKFYKYIEDKDIELQKDGPTPPRAVLKSYYKQFGNDAIRETILFGGLTDIENTQRVTVKKLPNNSVIGVTAKKNRERKKIMREIISQKTDEEDPEDSAESNSTSTHAPEPSKNTSESVDVDSGTDGIGGISGIGGIDRTIADPAKEDSPHIPRISKHFTESKRAQLRKSIDPEEQKRISAVAARHDMRERYELERYYFE